MQNELSMKVAIIGATGMVGSVMAEVLAERRFPVTEFIPVASEASSGQLVVFNGQTYKVVTLEEALEAKPDIALFSAGASVSREWAKSFRNRNCRVIDNSSAWRMDTDIPLIVPEVNGDIITVQDFIIANPNCSTIQMVLVLSPLHIEYGIKRVVVSTYQSVSGTGKEAIAQMDDERAGRIPHQMVYPYTMDRNLFPHIDLFEDDGYTKEELKMVNETMKIMQDNNVAVTATCVRVPITIGHSESVNIEFHNDFILEDIRDILAAAPGVKVWDDVKQNLYPMPLDCVGKDDTFVGRLRRDYTQPNTLNCWIVADNLRVGAATNAIKIAEYLLEKKFV